MLILLDELPPYFEAARAVAVKGADENFRIAMVECYRRLAENMPDNGLQLVMFTHQDVDVWADLALILWSAGLRVTAAWTIATETDTSFRTGKYVQGTVLLVLRKRKENLRGDRSEIYPDVQAEVKRQLATMLGIDDKEDPNYGEGFAGSLLRQVLFAVYKTVEEDAPRPGLDYLKQRSPITGTAGRRSSPC